MDNRKILDDIESNYGLVATSIKPLGSESYRYVYLLTTPKEKYILRMFPEDRSVDQIKKDIEILKFLEKNDFPTQRIIVNKKGSFISKILNKNSIITTFIEGVEPQYNKETLFEVGKLMARLHNIKCSDYSYTSNWDPKSELKILKEHLAKIDLSKTEHSGIIPEVLKRIEELPDLTSLPKTIIHTDIHPRNMVKGNNNNYYFIDWDDAGLGLSVMDIGFVLGQVCMGYSIHKGGEPKSLDFDEDLAKSFLSGYYSVRKLSAEEKQMLVYAMQACTLIYVIHYWSGNIDFECFKKYKIQEKNKEKLIEFLRKDY